MTEKQKNVLMNFIPLVYGIFVVLANIFGVIISGGFSTPSMMPAFMQEWQNFLHESPSWVADSQVLTFAVPTVLCVLYVRTSGKNFDKRFINLPLAYSALGVTGWIVYFFEQIYFLIYAVETGYAIEIPKVMFFSGMYAMFAAVSTFTFVYFILESIHRGTVLPLYFPQGQLSKIKGIAKPSVRLLFFINYFSVTVFPVVFLLVLYFLASERFLIPVEKSTFVVFALIILMGILITLFLGISFEKPLEKFKERIKKLNDGDFKSKVNVIRNDIFGELSDSFNEMTDSIAQKTQKIIATQNSVIQGMAIMVESRDNSTGGHIKRTSDCIRVFVKKLKEDESYKEMPATFFDSVIKAAPMHDLGKIAVDDAILRKPGKFTAEEYEIMKTHSKEGARIVENVLCDIDDAEFQRIATNVAHYHHEKWDGSGYPEKLSGTEIPLEARIMALADVFDALVSKRCYKEEFGFEKAFGIIKDSLGTHFDPALGVLFLQCRDRLEDLYARNATEC